MMPGHAGHGGRALVGQAGLVRKVPLLSQPDAGGEMAGERNQGFECQGESGACHCPSTNYLIIVTD